MWIKVNFSKSPAYYDLPDLRMHYKGNAIEKFDYEGGIDDPNKQWIKIDNDIEGLKKINEDSFPTEWGFIDFLHDILVFNLLYEEPCSLIFDIGDACMVVEHLSKSHNWNEWTNVETITGYIFYLDTDNYRLIIECKDADTVTIDLAKTNWSNI